MLQCEKTGAVIYLEWENCYILTDTHLTSDGTLIFKASSKRFDKSPRGVVHYRVTSYAKRWLEELNTYYVLDREHYEYFGYEGRKI